jgi:hypothetical protein
MDIGTHILITGVDFTDHGFKFGAFEAKDFFVLSIRNKKWLVAIFAKPFDCQYNDVVSVVGTFENWVFFITVWANIVVQENRYNLLFVI